MKDSSQGLIIRTSSGETLTIFPGYTTIVSTKSFKGYYYETGYQY